MNCYELLGILKKVDINYIFPFYFDKLQIKLKYSYTHYSFVLHIITRCYLQKNVEPVILLSTHFSGCGESVQIRNIIDSVNGVDTSLCVAGT